MPVHGATQGAVLECHEAKIMTLFMHCPSQPAANSQEYPLRYHDLRRNEYLRYYKVRTPCDQGMAIQHLVLNAQLHNLGGSASRDSVHRAVCCCVSAVFYSAKLQIIDTSLIGLFSPAGSHRAHHHHCHVTQGRRPDVSLTGGGCSCPCLPTTPSACFLHQGQLASCAVMTYAA
jgi:hypothetical protein